jgi:hypothetical protein
VPILRCGLLFGRSNERDVLLVARLVLQKDSGDHFRKSAASPTSASGQARSIRIPRPAPEKIDVRVNTKACSLLIKWSQMHSLSLVSIQSIRGRPAKIAAPRKGGRFKDAQISELSSVVRSANCAGDK